MRLQELGYKKQFISAKILVVEVDLRGAFPFIEGEKARLGTWMLHGLPEHENAQSWITKGV